MPRKRKIDLSNSRKEIIKKLMHGLSGKEISKWLQEERNEDISPKLIENYGRDLFNDWGVEKTREEFGSGSSEIVILDEFEKLIELYNIQYNRLKICLKKERNENEIDSKTDKQIDLTRKLLEECIKVKNDIKMEMEKNGEAREEVTLEEVLMNVSPEKKRDFLSTFEKAIKAIEDGAME